MLFVYIVGTSIIWTTVLGTDCPSNWMVFQASCYHFVHQNLSFVEAEQHCHLLDSHLVHIETSSENTFLKDYVSYMNDDRWWIGLTDDVIDGYWMWYGTDRTATFTDWHQGEPNNDIGNGGNEDCGDFLFLHGKWAWNDERCSWKLPAICEINKSDGGAVVG